MMPELRSELRKDAVINRWVIVAPERGARPHEFARLPEREDTAAGCPLCEHNEHMTPHEVFAVRDKGEPDRPGWYVRVVPNKFPALRIEGDPAPGSVGPYQRMNGIGAHEVIVESPRHEDDLAFTPAEQVIRVLTAVRRRTEDLRRDERFRHVIVFRNHGQLAGASLGHPHSQVIALPIVPRSVQEFVSASAQFHTQHGRCIFCDVLDQELAADDRIITHSEHFVVLAPYASRFAYEAAIYPRRHCHDIVQMSAQEQADLAHLLRRLLMSYRAALFNPPYNMVYQTAPSLPSGSANGPGGNRLDSHYHWRIEIMPRLTTFAGFEWGTGFYINPVAPEDAADKLRENLP